MSKDKKIIIAVILAVIAIIGAVIYYCSLKPEYDDLGNMIETTTIEEITDETTITETTSETTTDLVRPTETTTTKAPSYNRTVKPVEVKNSAPDQYIAYNDKRLDVNFSMESLKTILGEPIVFVQETTTEATSEAETSLVTETETETTTQESENKSHRYREFIVSTKIEKGVEVVKDIQVVSEKINNLLGFSPIGKPLYEITLTYGQPSYEDFEICKYNIDDNSYLYFKLIDGMVNTWGIASQE